MTSTVTGGKGENQLYIFSAIFFIQDPIIHIACVTSVPVRIERNIVFCFRTARKMGREEFGLREKRDERVCRAMDLGPKSTEQ